jgi:hypothetical protein
VEDPTDQVIDELGVRVCLVATLMSDNPKPGSHEASGKAVQRPEGKAGERIGGRRWKGNVLGGNERFDVRGRFINDTDEEKVP